MKKLTNPTTTRRRRIIGALLVGASLGIGGLAMAPAANAFSGDHGCMSATYNNSYRVIATDTSMRITNSCPNSAPKGVQVLYSQAGVGQFWSTCVTMPSRSTRDWNATWYYGLGGNDSGSKIENQWQYC